MTGDLRSKANILLQKKRYKDAEKAYRKLSQNFPNDPAVLYPLGLASSELTDYGNAIDCFKKTIQLQPMHGMAFHQLAKAYLAQKKYNLAEDHFIRAMQIRRQDHLVYADYSRLLRETGRPGQAKKYMEDATITCHIHTSAWEIAISALVILRKQKNSSS